MGCMDNDWRWKVGGWIAIATLAMASTIGSLFGDFVFDDSEAIVNNRDLHPDTPWSQLLLNDFWGTRLTHSLSHKSYRPLTVATFRLNFLIFGRLVPWSFHLVNICLHVCVCLLLWHVYAVVIGEGKSLTCLWACCLFAAHPIHTEAVCGIVGRADLLAALWFLLSFLAYARSTSCKGHLAGIQILLWLTLSVFLAAAAMLSKEQGITVLGFNLAYEIVAVQNMNIWRMVRRRGYLLRTVLLVASAATLLWLRCYLMDFRSPSFHKVDNPATFDPDWLVRLLSLQYIACLNFWLLLCPDWLCFDWSMGCVPLISQLSDVRVMLSACCWLTWALLIATCFWRGILLSRAVLLSLAMMVIPFLPASNLLFRVGFVIAERVLFIPSAGFCLLVALGIERLFTKRDVSYPLGMVLIVFIIKSHIRSLEWRAEMPLFMSGLRVCPNNAKVRYNVAKSAADRGLTDRAIAEYREAIRLHPEYEQALNNLGNLMKTVGELEEAERLLRRALRVRPDFPAAWMNLGVVLATRGRPSDAESAYFQALKLRANYPDCYYNLGNLYLEQRWFAAAEEAWLNATRLKPAMTTAWNNLIMLHDNQGNHTGAVLLAEAALSAAGEQPSFHFHLANAYGKMAAFATAEVHFRRALALDPHNALYHVNLGVLYHRWGNVSLAEQAYLNAIRLNPKLESARQNYNMLKKKLAKT